MLYTEDFTMRHYVGFLQIGSHISYNIDTPALPDIYALALGRCAPSGIMRIYQTKHSCLCYNLYIINTDSKILMLVTKK